MPPYQPDLSDFRMTDFYGLRVRCIEKMWQEPSVRWSHQELVAINELILDYAAKLSRENLLTNHDWRDNPGLRILTRDLEELPDELDLPKWASLSQWLAPESVAGSAPELIASIAKLALSNRLTARIRG